MDTRKTVRTHGSDREDNLDDPGQLPLGGEDEEWPTLQDPPAAPEERRGTKAVLREAHSRLAELLLAAASILAEISSSAGAETAADILQGRPADSRQNDLAIPAISSAATFGRNGDRHVGAGLQARHLTSSTRAADRHQASAIGAAILHTDGAAGRNHDAEDDFIFQQRLPALSAFKAEGGDWGQFQRRFLAHQEMSAWSDATALRALPAMLDDNALAAFMSARRQKADTETALTYRTALLALADAAFPRMDEEGQDAMVLEQLLKLAQDLGVPINTADEIDISSLRVATSIQAHEALQRKQGVVCNAAVASTPGPVITELQVVSPREEAFTAGRPGDWRSGGRSPLRSTRKLEQPRSRTTLITCYNCGLRGHVASGCRAPRQRAMGSRLDDDQGPKASLQTPASRGTSHARPTHSTRMGRRGATEEGRLGFGDSDRDSLLSLSLGEWGRLQMADSSLLALRRRVGGPKEDQERTCSYVLKQGMLMRWDKLSRRHALVVPSASAAAVTDAFVQGYVLDKGAPERLLTDQGVSELTAADHRRPDLRGGAGPFRPVPRRLEQPEPPDGRQCPVPYDGPARRTRARSRYFV
ncbi:unnamed protein product [Lampetra fluviatilis]